MIGKITKIKPQAATGGGQLEYLKGELEYFIDESNSQNPDTNKMGIKDSRWFGSLAKDLKLNGACKFSQIQNLALGYLPNSETEEPYIQTGGVGKKDAHEKNKIDAHAKHAQGYEFAFSAPKSVSVKLNLTTDKEESDALRSAHDRAVEKAMEYAEENLIIARRGAGGYLRTKTGEMIASLFTHHKSRAGDPQLHTHAVIYNLTQTADGKVSAFESQRLMKAKLVLGQIYQNYLAEFINEEIQKGTIKNDCVLATKLDKGISCDLGSVDRHTAEVFSTRSTQINKFIEQKAKDGNEWKNNTQARQVAALATRDQKDKLKEAVTEQDKMNWRAKAKIANKSFLKTENQYIPLPEYEEAFSLDALKKEVTRLGLEKLGANVTEFDVVQAALELSFGKVPVEEALEAANTILTDGSLINLETNCDVKIFAVKEQLELEEIAISKIGEAIKQCDPIEFSECTSEIKKAISNMDEELKQINTDYALKDEQREAARYLANNGFIKSIIGAAGTGKSTMLKTFVAAHQKKYAEALVIGTSTSQKASTALDGAGIDKNNCINCYKLYKRIISKELVLKQNDVIIVDEAGMVNTVYLSKLVEACADAKAKLILVGDPEQIPAIGAGGLFKLIANTYGNKELLEVTRQENESHRNAGLALRAGNVKGFIDEMKDSIFLLDKEEQLTTELVEDICRSKVEWKDKAAINVTRAGVAEINKQIQAKRIELEQISTGYQILISQQNTAEKKFKTFCVGDRILITKNKNDSALKNGLLGEINSIQANEFDDSFDIKLTLDSGDTVEFNTNDFDNIDLGYAMTAHKAQGVTLKEAYFAVDGNINKNLGYVCATRHKNDMKIYMTKDQERFVHKRLGVSADTRTVSERVSKISTTIQKREEITRQKHAIKDFRNTIRINIVENSFGLAAESVINFVKQNVQRTEDCILSIFQGKYANKESLINRIITNKKHQQFAGKIRSAIDLNAMPKFKSIVEEIERGNSQGKDSHEQKVSTWKLPATYTQEQLNQWLFAAAHDGDYNKAVEVMKAGANINFEQTDQERPLHRACSRGKVEIVKLLLSCGAENTECLGVGTPLEIAMKHGHHDCVGVIVQHLEQQALKHEIARAPKSRNTGLSLTR